MTHILGRLSRLFNIARVPQPVKTVAIHEPHVVVPEAVALPLPRSPREEMSVPASINGRDLSTGRL
ncbi:hypothetical protein GAO09_24255 [Rhizobiales bacterium RZME27]|uniref:Uncharacterized protein n=1 Tax=Endobacterium cereale TaxID=2663029 RepID=A0A6A8AEH8_9HYPH|nr:hypothetical protein [Endobacterium cereale]MEB2847304.1 hypothetical protein [Endobacterium cereale]MQY49154.1 hypothetical protein [Endobacterium cereale]